MVPTSPTHGSLPLKPLFHLKAENGKRLSVKICPSNAHKEPETEAGAAIKLPFLVRSLDNLPESIDYRLLTKLEIKACDDCTEAIPRLGDGLLDILQKCVSLEVLSLKYGHGEIGSEPRKTVSLPRLRSFTHESPLDTIGIDLFDHLSLPSACDVQFIVTDFKWGVDDPWGRGFPALRDPPRAKLVELMVHPRSDLFTMVQTRLSTVTHRRISFTRLVLEETLSAQRIKQFLDFFGSYEMASSVETLSLEFCLTPPLDGVPGPDLTGPLLKWGNLSTLMLWKCDPVLFLQNPAPSAEWCPGVKELVIFLPLSTDPQKLLDQVQNIAVTRQEIGNPLKKVSLSFEKETRVLEECGVSIPKLEWLQVV